MRHKRKSIGAKRSFKKKQTLDIFYVTFCAVIAAGLGYHYQHTTIKTLLSPIARVQAEVTLPTPTIQAPGTIDSNTNPTQDEIESYIRRIFVDDPDTAIAVSRAECNPQNKSYPHCVADSSIEHSVGIFQVNLYNVEQKVHADRIPGTTMEEKESWLSNPFNCTLYAWWLYSSQGNSFNAWSTFTSGKYLQYLNN